MKTSVVKLAIVTPGLLPVPAVDGGAVESLCENFIKHNEMKKNIQITVFSCYSEKAELSAKKLQYTDVKFIKAPQLVRLLDLLMYSILKVVLPRKNTAPFRYMAQRIHFVLSVSRQIAAFKYDHVLFENQILLLSALKWNGNLGRYKNQYSLHTHNQITRTFGNTNLVLGANNITVSNYISNNLKNALNDFDNTGTYTVVRNGIDQMSFSRNFTISETRQIRKGLGIATDQKVLLFVGRLTPEKGIDKLVMALDRVKNNNFKLLIIGSSFFGADVKNPFVSKLDKLAESVKDRIIFTGHVSYFDMPGIYSIADIAILPSVGVDAAPLTIVESLTAGLPIITTDSGGIPEYVNEDCAKILKRDKYLESNIAKNIDLILSEQQTSAAMSRASLAASQELTLDNYYMDMLNGMKINGNDYER